MPPIETSLHTLGATATDLTTLAVLAGAAIAAALALHMVLFAVLGRLARRSAGSGENLVVRRVREPLRWLMVAVALSAIEPFHPAIAAVWGRIDRLVVPALVGWVAFGLVRGIALALEARAAHDADAVAVRSQRTRIRILSRMVRFLIAFVTVALVLYNIPGVRAVGSTLLASAGLAGLAVGAAAQPALKSLIAGLQIALTEPIRIDDYIVVDGEAGRVEDIRLSYVVIRTGDERRLIVPTAKFLDSSFQNWTREGGGLTGSVVLRILPGHAIAPIREAYLARLAAASGWDKRNGALIVSDALLDTVEIKLIMSAADPAALGDLRLELREAMLEWLREEMPDALCTEPRH